MKDTKRQISYGEACADLQAKIEQTDSGTAPSVQVEYSREAKVLASQYRTIGNPNFSMGKTCTICGMPILNTFKVLTCQDCRHDQHQAKV